MPSNDEYDSLDNGNYGGTPDYSEGEHSVYEMPWIPFIVFNIEMFVIFPIILIANLLLFIKIVGNKKIRSEPWRWLIAHASVVFFVGILLLYDDLLSGTYGVPSLVITPVCPIFVTFRQIIWNMSIVSVVLVVTERFHALRLGRENEGGMTKKAVILTLVIFWILLIISQILPMFIIAKVEGHPAFFTFINAYGQELCQVHNSEIYLIIHIILNLWALLTFIVAIIGMVVLRNRKTTTELMKKSIITPTLAVASIALVFLAIYHLFNVTVYLGYNERVLIYLLGLIHEIAFPIIWLVTWSRNGDISLKCSGEDDGEHKPLLEEK